MKVIGFFGGDSGVGTTMLAQSAAEAVSARGKRPLLIYGSSKYFDAYLEDLPEMGLDRLRGGFRSFGGSDTDEFKAEVRGLIISGEDFDYIPGPVNMTGIMHFAEAELVAKIVAALGGEYEYVLVDCGDNVNYPLTVSGLLAADKRYYVLTQNEKCVRRFLKVRNDVLKPMGLDLGSDKIIVNKQSRSGVTYRAEEVASLVEMPMLAVARVYNGEVCEIERSGLMKRNAQFARQLAAVAEDFME